MNNSWTLQAPEAVWDAGGDRDKHSGQNHAEIGVYARVGIGPNKALAKIACDNFAKRIRTVFLP